MWEEESFSHLLTQIVSAVTAVHGQFTAVSLTCKIQFTAGLCDLSRDISVVVFMSCTAESLCDRNIQYASETLPPFLIFVLCQLNIYV